MEKKNPHAVALGRLGGKKGGKTRMVSMTPQERSEFARKGGKARQAKARLKRGKNELSDKLNDGRWAIEQLPLFKRIDWENVHRERSIALFGKRFYVQQMTMRVIKSLDENSG